MNAVQRLAKNSTSLFISYAISQIFILFSGLFTARELGADKFGMLSFASAFVLIFSIILDVGFHQLTVREIAKNNELGNSYFINISFLKLVLSIPYFFFIILIIFLLNFNLEILYIVIITSSAILINSFVFFCYSLFQAYEKIVYIALGHVLNASIIFLGIGYAIINNFSVIGFAIIPLFANIINLILYFFLVNKVLFKIELSLDWSFLKKNIKQAIPFGLTSVFVIIYLWNGSIFLSLFSGNEAVGFFNASYKIVLALLGISYAVNASIFPLMSKIFIQSPNKIQFISNIHFKILLYLAIPISFGGTVLANQLITLFLGTNYSSSIFLFQILIWAIPFIFVRTTLERVFEITNKQFFITIAYGLGFIVSILLNILIIPNYGAIGASFTILFVDISIFVFLFSFSKNIHEFKFNKIMILDVLRSIISSIIMVIFLVYANVEDIIINIIIGIFIYTTSIFLLKGINKQEKMLLKQIAGI